MTELTKEHFDKQLKKLATKDELKHLATKKKDLEEQIDELARIVTLDARVTRLEQRIQPTQAKGQNV